MEKLSKQIINNFIVKHRENVRQSTIQVISKLTREAKKFKDKRAENEQQKEKNVRRADRYLEEVKFLKTLHPDDILKFVLMNKKHFEDIANEPNPCIEERALCRISDHKSIKVEIADLREKYTDWPESIPNIIKSLGALHRKERLNRMQKKGKRDNLLERERRLFILLNKYTDFELDPKLLDKISMKPKQRKVRGERLEKERNESASKENLPSVLKNIPEGLEESPNNKTESCNNKKSGSDSPNSESIFELEEDVEVSTDSVLNVSKKPKGENKTFGKDNATTDIPSKPSFKKLELNKGPSSIKKIDLTSLQGDFIKLDKDSKSDNSDSEDERGFSKQSTKRSSSFFLSHGSNDEYKGEINQDLEENSQKRKCRENEDDSYVDTSKYFRRNLYRPGLEKMSSAITPKWSADFQASNRKGFNSRSGASYDHNDRRSSYGHQDGFKRKNTENSRDFSAKNQKYDSGKTLPSRERRQQKTELKEPSKVELHPSWQAKKQMGQQAASIKQFQGTRITFDD